MKKGPTAKIEIFRARPFFKNFSNFDASKKLIFLPENAIKNENKKTRID